MNKMITIFLLIFIRICICQPLPAGLELPPHWDKRFEVISYDNGALTYRDKATGTTNTIFITMPKHNEPRLFTPPIDSLPEPPLDTLFADTVLSIDVSTVDTAFYSPRFSLLGKVPLDNGNPAVIYDFDHNGVNDILGVEIFYEPGYRGGFNRFYEWQASESRFSPGFASVFGYNQRTAIEGGGALGGMDIDNDGRSEAWFTYDHELRFYEAEHTNGYPDALVHIIPKNEDVNPINALFYDFDKDGKVEMQYTQDTVIAGYYYKICRIWEHQTGNNHFQKTYRRLLKLSGAGNSLVGDMDGDGLIEFYFASHHLDNLTPGYVRMLGFENSGDNQYDYFWRGAISVVNRGLCALTNDMDSDGLPEIIIQGSGFTVEGKSLITIVESTWDNEFRAKASIAVKTPGSFGGRNGIAHGDVDGDGIEEFVVEISGWTLLFKSTGNDKYELFWIKHHNLSYTSIAMGDVNADDLDDIVISGYIWNPDSSRGEFRSDIYTFNPQFSMTAPVALSPPATPQPATSPAELLPGYPSPFNSLITIAFTLPQPATVQLDIFDLNGRLVTTIADGSFGVGRHQATWDGSTADGQPVASGVYFCRLSATVPSTGAGAVYTQVRKMLLMR